LTTLVRHLLLAAAALVVVIAEPAAAIDVHAHRGGALKRGKPIAAENSMSAFKSARARGASVIELDVHVSKDHVPLVIHDATLDRTTDCGGVVADHTAREIGACRLDVLGTAGVYKRVPKSRQRVPRLAAVLGWAKKNRVRLNVELKNSPNEPGYDSSSRAVRYQLDAIGASHIPKRLVLVQSFFRGHLAMARKRGYTTSLITFQGANRRAVSLARSGGHRVIEPQWPVGRALVKRAHAAGRKVIPYTLQKRSTVMAAAAAGVDGIITDDPTVARRAVRCFSADRRYRVARRQLAAARRALKRAKSRTGKRRAAARVRAAQRKVAKTRLARGRACA
jgi:glycerophosphoryl diester phosphodiesterase